MKNQLTKTKGTLRKGHLKNIALPGADRFLTLAASFLAQPLHIHRAYRAKNITLPVFIIFDLVIFAFRRMLENLKNHALPVLAGF